MADPTEDAEKIAAGQRAGLVLQGCSREIGELEDDILTRLVAAHASDTLTDTLLRGMVGEIAGLRKLEKVLSSKRRIGQQTSEKVHG